MSLLKLAACAIFFGSLYTIFRKYQSIVEIKPINSQFNEPILQSFIIFVGMCSIVIFKPWMKKEVLSKQALALPQDNKYIYIMPSFLDVLGTIVDTAGLYYTSVSISQMLKGSVLFFTYIITLFYLGKSLPVKKHLYMIAILLSLTIIGISNISNNQSSRFQSNPIMGNLLIIFSQFLFSLMFIYEEKILKQYRVKVQNAVLWQGIWGALIAGIIMIVLSAFKTPFNTNVLQSCTLICSNNNLIIAVICTALCIGPFNYFGISLTKDGSALYRCMICTFRMVIVWSVSLIFGWQKFHFLQLLGYSLLTFSIYQFNGSQQEEKQNAQMSYEEEAKLQSSFESGQSS